MSRYQTTESPIAFGFFPSGETVTIAVYDGANPTGGALGLGSNACTEITGTGIFVWDASNLSTPPSSFAQYAYLMTDSAGRTYPGKLPFGGYPDNVDATVSTRAVESTVAKEATVIAGDAATVAAIAASESAIRGGDSDTLEILSDQIDAIPPTDLTPVQTAVDRLFEDNQRSLLYYTTAAIPARNVPTGGVSHMKVETKAEGDADFSSPVEEVWIVFTYPAGADTTTPPATLTRADSAPAGTFTEYPYAS